MSRIKLTTRGRHAIVALVELSQYEDDSPVPLSKISDTSNISLSYLEQLFSCLRRKGIVKSYRGPGGGYVLSKAPEDILIADVLQASDMCLIKNKARKANKSTAGYKKTNNLWDHIGDILHVTLKHVSLKDVINDDLSSHPVHDKLIRALN